MKSTRSLFAILCLIALGPQLLAQDADPTTAPIVASTPQVAELPDEAGAVAPQSDEEIGLAPVPIPESMQVLRVTATLEGDIRALRQGERVHFYQQAMFSSREAQCLIAGMQVDPCQIHQVHGERGNNVDVSLIVPKRLGEHIEDNLTSKAKRVFFVMPVDSKNPARPMPPPRPVQQQLKTFALLNVKAADAERTISQLFRSDLTALAVDTRSNSLIARGRPEQLAEIEALLLRLDSAPDSASNPFGTPKAATARWPSPSKKKPNPGVADDPFATAGDGPFGASSAAGTDDPFAAGPAANTDDPYGGRAKSNTGAPTSQSVDVLRGRYAELEKRCADLARKIRQAVDQRQTTGRQAAQRDQLRGQLHQAVRMAFQARQQLHHAELTEFHARMKRIAQSMALREKIADQIIKHRVEELLNPSLPWDAPTDAAPTIAARANQAPQPGVAKAAPTLAEKVEREVAQRQQAQAWLQGSWVLARTRTDPQQQTIVIDKNAWQLTEVDGEVRTGKVNLDSRGSGRIAIDFGKNPFPRQTWLGSYEVTRDQLTVQFNSLNVTGASSEFSMVEEEDKIWRWSGVYVRAPEQAVSAKPAAVNRDSLDYAVRSALAVLRGVDNEETRLARAHYDKEWQDDIDRIQACPGHEKLGVGKVLMDELMAFVVTTPVVNKAGKHWVLELAFERQPDGVWELEMIDDEPADNVKRDLDRVLEDHPNARAPKTPVGDDPAGDATDPWGDSRSDDSSSTSGAKTATVTSVYVSTRLKTEVEGTDAAKTHARLLQSNVILNSAIESGKLDALPLLASREDRVVWLRDNLIVRPSGDGTAIEIGLTGDPGDRPQLAKIVNAIEASYQRFLKNNRRSVAAEVAQQLGVARSNLAEELDSALSKLDDLESADETTDTQRELAKREIERLQATLDTIDKRLAALNVAAGAAQDDGRPPKTNDRR